MGDGYEISIRKLAKQKSADDIMRSQAISPAKPRRSDPEVTADEPTVNSTDTEAGAKRFAMDRLARRKHDKQDEFDEEAGDGSAYRTPGEKSDDNQDKVWKIVNAMKSVPYKKAR